MARTFLLTGVMLLAFAGAALAARTDVVVLRNGDHFTGEVLSLRQNKLQLKTDDAGTISIEWDKIASVTTVAPYDLTLLNGVRLFGRFQGGAAGAAQILFPDGRTSSVRLAEIASFTQIKSSFWQRLDGSIDLGGSYTQSSGVAQANLDADVKYRRPAYQYAASLSTNLTHQPDVPDSSRFVFDLGYTRFRANRWVASTFGLFERNEDLGFQFRSTGAFTVGRYLLTSRRTELLVAGGLAAGRELPVGEDAVTNVDALGTMNLSVFTYDYPSTRLDVSLLVFPSLNDPGRVRLNAQGKLKRELFRDFYVSLSIYNTFDSVPRGTDAKRNDFGGALSFGYSF
ncbi:MAG TPA: DUF481 domain-containing protein [Vicinamibacterales bacterium]|nr:DUF481 domain-containing protein [Vicinamibacterales bacterium]